MKRVIVIGAGPGGYVAAIRAAQMGASVLLVEKDKVGGTCLNYGCIPTKAIISSVDLFNKIKKSKEFGIEVKEVSVSMEKIVERKEKIVTILRRGVEALIKKNKIELVKGRGKVIGKHSILVETREGQKTFEGEKIILALGSGPRPLKGVDFDGKHILSSDDLLDLKEVPESMAIIGGGVIGCEFAYILASLGCRVHIIEALDRLLPVPGIDRYISSSLLREMKKRKISVSLNSLVETITMQDNGKLNIAYVDKNKNETKIVECDKVAVCIGRAPLNFDMDLSLELTDSGWIKVDELFRTSNENIYAIGDCLGPTRPMLAHVAMHEAICCVSNIFGKTEKMDYTNVPSVVYTNPEIGCVGLTEEMAKQREIDFDVAQVMFRAIGRSHTSGEISGDAKILFDKKSKKILGIHVIGPHASELIGVGCVLLKNGASVEDVEKTIFAHPTLSEIFHEISLKSLSMPIHG